MALSKYIPPLIMGLLMGPMMLWMLHGVLTGGGVSTVAALVFVGMHVVAVLVALGTAFWAARLSPRMRAWLTRVHRPSARHAAVMLGSAAVAALLTHSIVHGLL